MRAPRHTPASRARAARAAADRRRRGSDHCASNRAANRIRHVRHLADRRQRATACPPSRARQAPRRIASERAVLKRRRGTRCSGRAARAPTRRTSPRRARTTPRADRPAARSPDRRRPKQARLGETAHRARERAASARASPDRCCSRGRPRTAAAPPANRDRAPARAPAFPPTSQIDSCSVRVRGSCIASAESRSASPPNRTRRPFGENAGKHALHVAQSRLQLAQVVRPPRRRHRRERTSPCRARIRRRDPAASGRRSPGNHGAACASARSATARPAPTASHPARDESESVAGQRELAASVSSFVARAVRLRVSRA